MSANGCREDYFLRYFPSRGEVVRRFIGDINSLVVYDEWCNGHLVLTGRECSAAVWLAWTRHAREMGPDEFADWCYEHREAEVHDLPVGGLGGSLP